MRRIVGGSAAVVLGTCLALTAVAAGATSPPPVEARQDGAGAWHKLWDPTFRPAPGTRTGMEAVRWLGDRYAILGTDGRGAVVWWSDDGLEWIRTPPSDATDRGIPAAIAAGPDGYVMVGSQRTPTPRGRIWHSADGIEWQPAQTKLPPGSGVLSVASTGDGTFVAYGDLGRVRQDNGCWVGLSADGGVTWDYRWEGDWDPGSEDYCVVSAAHDGTSLVGRIGGGISESADGIAWQQLVTWTEMRRAYPKGGGLRHDVGLVPLEDGRFVLGGRGTSTLTWNRDDGLALEEDLIDWDDLGRVDVALGPDRAVAVKRGMPAPLLSPPADVHTEPWARRQPVCRARKPKLDQIAAMRPRERLECFGGRDLTFEAWIPFSEYGGTCPFGSPYDWMLCWNRWLASGPGDSSVTLNYGLAPNARLDRGLDPTSWGAHVRVTGHFDDPRASQCPERDWDEVPLEGWASQTRADFVNDCRTQFIVTRMRRIGQ
jgi:hypothetical protein